MKRLINILTIIILSSCGQKEQLKDYSDTFYKAITNNGIKLQRDSLIFPINSNIKEPILIPTTLSLNQEYEFYSENGITLKLKRKNYTDIEYELLHEKLIEKGISSLSPTFYLGAESVGTSEGEFWVTDYNVKNSKYLHTIRIGDEGLSDEEKIGVYIYIIPKPNCNFTKLVEIENLWKQKK